MEKKSMKGYLYLMPALIVILLFTIYPLIRAFIMSFMEDYNMINGTYSSVGFSNYVSIFKDKYFICSSVFYCIISFDRCFIK